MSDRVDLAPAMNYALSKGPAFVSVVTGMAELMKFAGQWRMMRECWNERKKTWRDFMMPVLDTEFQCPLCGKVIKNIMGNPEKHYKAFVDWNIHPCQRYWEKREA